MRRVVSDRGSVFLRCQLALTDRKFPKYPHLPVLKCSGYMLADADQLRERNKTQVDQS